MTRIRFEDLPSTNTPINAENLNKLNNVIVSSEEPTTGEEVWIQRGKNLYNPKNTYVSGDNSQNVIFMYKGIEVGKTYTFSAPNYSWLNVAFHNASGTFIRSIDGYASAKSLTFTIQENEASIGLTFYSGRENLTSINDIDFTGVQLEQGETVTSYEPYIDKKIYTNTGNGYEEFYNEEEHNKVNYSTSEQRIGTWIDGKPLYRQVVTTTTPKNDTYGLMLDLKSLKVDEMIIFDCKMVGNHSANPMPYYYSSTEYIYVGFGDGGIYGKAVGSATQGKPVRAILEYTKTTD